MEKRIDFLDLSCRRWVFLWDNAQKKILNIGNEAFEWWSWYQQESKEEDWRLVFPIRSGILQSAWALDEVLKFWVASQGQQLKSLAVFKMILSGANTMAEQQTMRQLVRQNILRPVQVIERATFFNDYLCRQANFSTLKLIVDLNSDYLELSIFLADKKLKNQHYVLAEDLTGEALRERLILLLDSFLLNLPRELLREHWQYFYIFIKPGLKHQGLIDQLNQHLKMEGVMKQEPLLSYVQK